MNTINNISRKENILLELCEKDYFELRQLLDYIHDLLNGLWEYPEKVASLIEKANFDDLKKYLAPLFAHNFYENIFSHKIIEDNLIYVLTLLIKSEIMNLHNVIDKNKFLENTLCGIMIEELMQKSYIQNYLIKITKNAIEYLETNNIENKITFDPDKIITIKNSNDENRNEKDELIYFNEKYMINLDKSSLMRLKELNINYKYKYEYLDSKIRIV